MVWSASLAAQGGYDLVIRNGRVIDPESGLDAVRNIGIVAGRVVAVSEAALEGERTLEATGLVVSPGFIDLHQHGQSLENYAAQVRDGITTALELEIGVEDIESWYQDRHGKALVNYGASISHPYSRQLAMLGHNPGLSGESLATAVTAQQMAMLTRRIERGLDQGARGGWFRTGLHAGCHQGRDRGNVPHRDPLWGELPRAYAHRPDELRKSRRSDIRCAGNWRPGPRGASQQQRQRPRL